MPKPAPQAVLAPILARWQAIIPELSFEIEEDGEDVVVVIRILGEMDARARIRREFLDVGTEEIIPHANRVIGAAIGSAA